MIKKLILKGILISISVSVFGQFEKYQSFEQLDSVSQVYFRANKADSAILAIEHALDNYPEHEKKATFILGFLYVRNGHDSKALKNWDYGQQKGYFYGLNNGMFKKHFGDNSTFKLIAETDRLIGEKLDSLSHIEYEIVKPENFSENKNYPLIFIFHGNGRNIEKAKMTWTSEIMTNDFITVFVQSYIHTSPYDFKWSLGDDKTTNELTQIYEEVIKLKNLDTNKIIFAGMSAGGMIALDYGFKNILSCSDYLLNCPVVPDIENDLVHSFVSSNKGIVIITGEKDFALEKQKRLIEKIKEQEGQAEIKIIAEMGHQFSNDFSSLLDVYLNKLLE